MGHSGTGATRRDVRGLYVAALDALLRGRVASVARGRDWALLREVARLAGGDAPTALAATDPALYETYRRAVTRYHLAGWSAMTPGRIDAVTGTGPAPSPMGER